MINKISTLDAVFITLMAACGLAIKPIVGPLGKIIGSFFLLPAGGSISGVIYVIWPMLALCVTQSFGTATLVGIIQGVTVMITGIYGSHGIMSLLTYTAPCLLVDVFYHLTKRFQTLFTYFIPAAVGNASGAFLYSFLFLHIPPLPLLITIIVAFISGGIGGIIASLIYVPLVRTFPQFSKEHDDLNKKPIK